MDCDKCYAYVHDTISRPFVSRGINHARALRNGHHLFAAEFVRIARGEDDSQFLCILFVEAGGVDRKCFTRNALPLANVWVHRQLHEIGDLLAIHSEHQPAPLRIRIPGKVYPDMTPKIHRVQSQDDLYT